ncbi:chloride channel protein [Oryzicola mucosus]|nr:chloride channel protein [Oryzicola mucosus]
MPRKPVARRAVFRRSRAMMASPRVWRPSLIFWAGAITIGVFSVAFAHVADTAQNAFTSTINRPGGWSYLPLILTPGGFALCAWLAYRYFPGSQGSGIPQAIAARHLTEKEDRTHLLSLKLAFGKIVLTIVGLLCGASIGREGPTVQVGAAIMLKTAQWGGMMRERGLILAGSAAGIAAAFNAPLAGIVFAIEEMGRSYEARANGLVLSTVIISGLASLALVGQYTYFGVSRETIAMGSDWFIVLICGVLGGALGAVFSAFSLKIARRIRDWNSRNSLKRYVIIAAFCGLGVGIIGVATAGATFGTGYDQARTAIEGEPLPSWFFIGKFVAGVLSMASGIPGGIFAPSLAVGAGLGSSIGVILGTGIGSAALLGMAGYFAGVVQAPMTAFVIILEMTGNNDNVIALMCASMLGYGTARLISNEPLYHALSRMFIADALRKRRKEDSDNSRVPPE